MRIIIIGDGKVGYNLAEQLSGQNNDVVIVDKDPEALGKAIENLDVMCIKGSGLSTKILIDAGVRHADILIAATNSDEMNMVCCLTAKKIGAQHTIARIRDPEYADELSQLKADLELDLVINPEQAVALEISRLLKFPAAAKVDIFSKGRVEMVEVKATKDMSIVNIPLRKISHRLTANVLIGAVYRDGRVLIPKGDFVIKENDLIYIVGDPAKVYNFCKNIGIYVHKVKNVMVMGGGRAAYYLAQYLDEMRIKVKILERDWDRCIKLAELLPHALIINGDGTDDQTLDAENLDEMDAFISLTGDDEDNLFCAILAKRLGVPKVVAKIYRTNYLDMIGGMGLDNVVSPKHITAEYILEYVRGLENAMGNPVKTLYRIIDDKAEAMEFIASGNVTFLDVPLRYLKMVEGVLIAAIVRRNEIIIPHGDDVIKIDDSVILISTAIQINDLNDVLESRQDR